MFRLCWPCTFCFLCFSSFATTPTLPKNLCVRHLIEVSNAEYTASIAEVEDYMIYSEENPNTVHSVVIFPVPKVSWFRKKPNYPLNRAPEAEKIATRIIETWKKSHKHTGNLVVVRANAVDPAKAVEHAIAEFRRQIPELDSHVKKARQDGDGSAYDNQILELENIIRFLGNNNRYVLLVLEDMRDSERNAPILSHMRSWSQMDGPVRKAFNSMITTQTDKFDTMGLKNGKFQGTTGYNGAHLFTVPPNNDAQSSKTN